MPNPNPNLAATVHHAGGSHARRQQRLAGTHPAAAGGTGGCLRPCHYAVATDGRTPEEVANEVLRVCDTIVVANHHTA